MLYYIMALIITFILLFLHQDKCCLSDGRIIYSIRSWKKMFVVLLPLTFLAAFRWNVGVDSFYGGSYWITYHNAAVGKNPDGMEPLFYLMMCILAKARVPYFFFLFIHAVLFMYLISNGLSKGSLNVKWSVAIFFLLFFYFDSFSSLRQSLSEGVCLIMLAEMGSEEKAKKDIKCLALIVIAVLFHRTALLYIPIYIACRFCFTRRSLVCITITGIILSPLIGNILRFLMRLFSPDKYEFRGMAKYNLLLSAVIAIIAILVYDSVKSLHRNTFRYINLTICIFFIMLNSSSLFLAYRVFDALKIGYVLIVPHLLQGIKTKNNRILAALAIGTLFGYWFIKEFFFVSDIFRNYSWIFDNFFSIIKLK